MKVFLQFLFFLIDRTMFVMRREIFLHFWSFFFVFNSINCDESKKKPNVSIISTISSNIFFQEQFQNESQWSKWIRSEAKRDGVDEHIAQYDGHWAFEIPSVSIYNDDFGLVLKVRREENSMFDILLVSIVKRSTLRDRCCFSNAVRFQCQSIHRSI